MVIKMVISDQFTVLNSIKCPDCGSPHSYGKGKLIKEGLRECEFCGYSGDE